LKRDKRSSLFCHTVDDEAKKLMTLTTGREDERENHIGGGRGATQSFTG
jgi:hypothetical protein